jgi:hypothetical protein
VESGRDRRWKWKWNGSGKLESNWTISVQGWAVDGQVSAHHAQHIRNGGTLAGQSWEPGIPHAGRKRVLGPILGPSCQREAIERSKINPFATSWHRFAHSVQRFCQPFMGVTNLTISRGCARAREAYQVTPVTGDQCRSVSIDSRTRHLAAQRRLQAKCKGFGQERPGWGGRPRRFNPRLIRRHPHPLSRRSCETSLPLSHTKDRALIFGGAVLKNPGSVWMASRRASQTRPCEILAWGSPRRGRSGKTHQRVSYCVRHPVGACHE